MKFCVVEKGVIMFYTIKEKYVTIFHNYLRIYVYSNRAKMKSKSKKTMAQRSNGTSEAIRCRGLEEKGEIESSGGG